VIPTLCAQCGKEVPEGAAHCPHCGAPLAAVAPPAPVVPVKPHRGAMILAFGIIGIVLSPPCCCPIVGLPFGIAAWVMGSGDLAGMEAGRMDVGGRGLTQAGKICGIVAVVISILAMIAGVVMFAMGVTVPESFGF
jgi:hypothetical protein